VVLHHLIARMKTIVLVLALCLSLAAATAPLLNGESKTIVPDQYMIVFHKNSTVQIRDFHVQELRNKRFARKEFDRIINTFDIGDLIGYSAVLSKETLALELEHHNIRYIEADQYVSINDEPFDVQPSATWGIDRLDQVLLPLDQTYHHFRSAGEGVTAYIIDTGVLIAHQEFGTRGKFGYNAVAGETDADCNGHGTHVAGTIAGNIYGIAKKSTVVAVKVLGCSGSGTWAGVVSGIDWVTKDHTGRGRDSRSVANMSLGGGATPTVDAAVDNSVIAGVNHVVAAGNNGLNACNYSPARAPRAITVGASDSTDTVAYFSNHGTCVDIFAPGVSITSSWIGSNTATNTISGTSMASPHVAGAVAIRLGHLLANGELTPPTPEVIDFFLKEESTKDILTGLPASTVNYLLYSEFEDVEP